MGHKRTDEVRKDALRITLTRGVAYNYLVDDFAVSLST